MSNALHKWTLSFHEAKQLQLDLSLRIISDRPLKPFKAIAAADVSFDRKNPIMHAGVVVVDMQTLEVRERVSASQRAHFPYVPGYLAFREVPVLLQAFAKLKSSFDVVMCDGQGIAHPRGLGLASHLGLWLDFPTIGCAKRLLWGVCSDPGNRRGAHCAIKDGDKQIGSVLRTRDDVHPVFVSLGHLCDLASARSVTLQLATKTRVPTPLRFAHDLANCVRRQAHGIGCRKL